MKGVWPRILDETLNLRDRLLDDPALSMWVRRIEPLSARLDAGKLVFEDARSLL